MPAIEARHVLRRMAIVVTAGQATRSTDGLLMRVSDRRRFLRSSGAAALSLAVPADLFAQAASVSAPGSATWDAGGLRHLLPTVSDTRMLVKASFSTPLMDAPTLSVGGTSLRGQLGDTQGEHLHLYRTGLQPQ